MPRIALDVSSERGAQWFSTTPRDLPSPERGRYVEQLVSAALFNGETTYVPERGGRSVGVLPLLVELRRLVRGRGKAVEALVGMRGKQPLLSRSQLEAECGLSTQL